MDSEAHEHDQRQVFLSDSQATEALGAALADAISVEANRPLVIFLQGDLGAGKTTFSRGFIHSLGHTGAVKSPTYTLVEPYENTHVPIFHFDLYRLADPEELEFIGIRDYFQKRCILLVEWPVKGQGYLPQADLGVSVSVVKKNAHVGREARITAHSVEGRAVLASLQFD